MVSESRILFAEMGYHEIPVKRYRRIVCEKIQNTLQEKLPACEVSYTSQLPDEDIGPLFSVKLKRQSKK